MAKRLFLALTLLCLLLVLLPAAVTEESTETESIRSAAPILTARASQVYGDVNDGDWFQESVDYVLERGLMNGVSGEAFGPEESLSRAMVVTTLHRIEGSPSAAVASFYDVPAGTWYTEAVYWAEANSIVYGVDYNTFAPDAPVTREQLAAILYRYATAKGFGKGSVDTLNQFADRLQVSDYARVPLGWACTAGLITGTGGNTMDPKGTTTRAQMATIMMRLEQKMADLPQVPPEPTPVSWTVIFEENHPGAGPCAVVEVPSGGTVSPLPDPSRQGYTFEGWYTQAEGGERRDFPQPVREHVVYYAHWSGSSQGLDPSLGFVPDLAPSRELILAYLDQYDPDGAFILRKAESCGENFLVWWDNGETIQENLNTAIHEEEHLITIYENTGLQDAYYVGGGEQIPVNYTETYLSTELTAFIPEALRSFRYGLYIAGENDPNAVAGPFMGTASESAESLTASVVVGAYGMLNEFAAYSWGMNHTVAVFPYYREHAVTTEAWRAYINQGDNDRQAFAEFRYFILTYLLYAQSHYPDVYQGIMNNSAYKAAFQRLYYRYAENVSRYDALIQEIPGLLAAQGIQTELTENAFTFDDGAGHTMSAVRTTFTEDYNKLSAAIQAPEYQAILAALLS